MPATPWWLLLDACLLCGAAAYPEPLIIAHRGTPCALPEETLEGFQQAIDDGADFVEMDVVSTKDGRLVCRHDIILDDSTNVAEIPQFADRRQSKLLPDGRNVTGFFVQDFTLEEVKQLYARQVIPSRDQASSYQCRIPTVDEALELVATNRKPDRPVGIYIEVKQPSFHGLAGQSLEPRLAAAIATSGLASHAADDVILQSFEPLALENLKREMEALGLPAVQLVWLMSCVNSPSEEQLGDFARYGTHIGPDKSLLVPLDWTEECNRPRGLSTCLSTVEQTCAGRLPPEYAAALNGSQPPPTVPLIESAKTRGLGVHSFTFRNEGRFQALDFRSDAIRELDFYRTLGVNGMFVDCPETAVAWRSCGAGDGNANQATSWGWWVAIAAAGVVVLKIGSVVVGIYGWRWWRARRQKRLSATAVDLEAPSGDREMSSRELPNAEQARDVEPLLTSEIRMTEMNGLVRQQENGHN